MKTATKATPPVIAGGNNGNGRKPITEKKINGYLDMRNIFHTVPEPVDYVLPGLVAGTVGSLVSPGATGKSLLALQLALKITSGYDAIGLTETASGQVTYLATEDPKIILHHRLHGIARNLSAGQRDAAVEKLHVAIVSGVNVLDPAWHDGLLKAAEGQRLVILDVLRRFHTEDENNTAMMSYLVSVLEEVCRKTDATILFLHHANKASAMAGMGDIQQASRGSGVLTDNIRWQAFLATMTTQEAKKYGIGDADRKRHVRFGIAKQNYGRPFEDIWLEKKYEKGIMERTYLEEIREGKKNENNYRKKL
jgi:RecA-family ATPase